MNSPPFQLTEFIRSPAVACQPGLIAGYQISSGQSPGISAFSPPFRGPIRLPVQVIRVDLAGPRQLPVYLGERTFSGQAGMSRCHLRTHAPQQTTSANGALFNTSSACTYRSGSVRQPRYVATISVMPASGHAAGDVALLGGIVYPKPLAGHALTAGWYTSG